jgi:hypothetical protein
MCRLCAWLACPGTCQQCRIVVLQDDRRVHDFPHAGIVGAPRPAKGTFADFFASGTLGSSMSTTCGRCIVRPCATTTMMLMCNRGDLESRDCQIVQPLFKICLSRRKVLFQRRTSLRHLKPPLGAAVVILIQWRATRCPETTASIPGPFHGGTAAPTPTGHMTGPCDASCRAEGGLSAITPSGSAIL